MIECSQRRSQPRFGSSAAGRGDAVAVARRIAAARVQRGVGRPRRRAFRQRQLAAHRDPDAVRALGVHAAERAPGPAVVRVARVGQRLRPVLDHLIRPGRPVVVSPARAGARCGRGRRRAGGRSGAGRRRGWGRGWGRGRSRRIGTRALAAREAERGEQDRNADQADLRDAHGAPLFLCILRAYCAVRECEPTFSGTAGGNGRLSMLVRPVEGGEIPASRRARSTSICR